ncbi:MAG: hypothetical protein LBP23_07025, partial [Treponema sp.]|nr:hypothetical protein [Treponema sp.]
TTAKERSAAQTQNSDFGFQYAVSPAIFGSSYHAVLRRSCLTTIHFLAIYFFFAAASRAKMST